MPTQVSLEMDEGLDKITSFENEHEAFAASRSSQYVFVPTRDVLFTILDQHADTVEGDVKLPLVILGNEGSGKSAFLANWVEKRREHKHKEEFLFQHFVGCSARSSQLGHMLFRLEKGLKDFFQLREMEVPESEERLRWSLNRFLAAAAKKYSPAPARIVIVIDAVNDLKGENSPRGALHWLPTELPPCVRFIVSTSEFERERHGSDLDNKNLNRTFMELTRRRCSMLSMDALSVNTRHNIISEFLSMHSGGLLLQESAQFKIVTAPASAQPLFLRSLLQALRLGVFLTTLSVDHLIDSYLRCSSARELIDKNLRVCYNAICDSDSDSAHNDVLGKMLSVVYVSRDGLSEDEVWSLLRLVTRSEPSPEAKAKLLAILKDISMVVNDLYSFSHQIYREVVYDKYIKTPDALVRWHFVMARYFGQLPPVARKLTCLPYHLEVAGSWSKVKNCLTDIEMFQLWWTPAYKSDFMKFWASLTAKHDDSGEPEASTLGADTNRGSDSRPTFDIVEEYTKSLDEYRTLRHPTEEFVANIILKVGEFLIDFATLGHEAAADVPYSIHPAIPSEDLKSIGVPHITIDKEGRTFLWYPTVYSDLGVSSTEEQKSDMGPADDIPSRSATKAVEDIPMRTAYFFNRWMWIQYPYVALGNCYQRYFDGIAMKEAIDGALGRREKSFLALTTKKEKSFFKKSFFKEGMSLTKSAPLPEIKFVRKAARSFRRVTEADAAEFDASDQFNQRLINLQDSIRNLKEEFDFLSQQRNTLGKRLYELKGALVDLVRAGESTSQFDSEQNEVAQREQIAAIKLEKASNIYVNLANLWVICERHPPHMPALITEVENKLDQDAALLEEIRKRLWEQKFEHNAHNVMYKEMKALVREGVHMHEQLLKYRLDAKKNMQKQGIEDVALLNSKKSAGPVGSRSLRLLEDEKSVTDLIGFDNSSQISESEFLQKSWEEKWSIVSSRTGINDPNIFFKRILNRNFLEDQIMSMRRTVEAKLEQLKKEASQVEAELEEVREEASLVGGQGSELYRKGLDIAAQQQILRRKTEITENAEHLQKKAIEGIRHIAEMLGESHDETAPITDVMRDVETMLENLLEEREKQLENHSQDGQQSPNRIGSAGKETTNEQIAFAKPHELAHVLDWMASPKARCPEILFSRHEEKAEEARRKFKGGKEEVQQPVDDDHDDEDHEGTWDRGFVKSSSLKNSLKFQKRTSSTTGKGPDSE